MYSILEKHNNLSRNGYANSEGVRPPIFAPDTFVGAACVHGYACSCSCTVRDVSRAQMTYRLDHDLVQHALGEVGTVLDQQRHGLRIAVDGTDIHQGRRVGVSVVVCVVHVPAALNNNKCSAVAEMGDRFATIDVGRKLGDVPLWGGRAGSTSNTMWPGPRPTSLPSGILIHPAV